MIRVRKTTIYIYICVVNPLKRAVRQNSYGVDLRDHIKPVQPVHCADFRNWIYDGIDAPGDSPEEEPEVSQRLPQAAGTGGGFQEGFAASQSLSGPDQEL